MAIQAFKKEILMLIIIDSRIPYEAKARLRELGDLLELSTDGVTYPAISGHPDIFFTQVDDQLLVAPNLPARYFEILKKYRVSFIKGESPVGNKYPETAAYNAVVTSQYLVHNPKITDVLLLKSCESKIKIQVKQAYTRCNLIFLNEDHAITSDVGIAVEMEENKIETLLVSPEGIELPGFKNGFFGGCCGLYENRLFILGNLDKFPDGKRVRDFIIKNNFEIVELCDTPLFDGGGIFFQSIGG